MNVLEQYLLGVGSTDLREHIIFRHPKTVDEAIAHTVEYEAVKGTYSGPVKPLFDEKAHSNAVRVKQANTSEQDTQPTCTHTDINDMLQKLLKCMEQLTEYSNKQTRYRVRRNLEDVECFRCHKKGHYANKCPNKGNPNQDQPQGN